jgi:Halocarboxylic acid dehydrogenase DehI
MSDPVPAVTEAGATGEIADIFADIRHVYQVGVVNLIWRHLATFPGALPWVWQSVRPVYVDDTIRREAAALRASIALPDLPVFPAAALAAVGLSGRDVEQIRAVLAAYDRTNAMALIALSAVDCKMACTSGEHDSVVGERTETPASSQAKLILPSLLSLAEMSPETAELVVTINRLGAQGDAPILASMYRHLAHWPPYLALAWTMLAPLDADDRLDDAISDALVKARASGRRVATRLPTPSATLAHAARADVSHALDCFTGDLIAKMVVIGALLRRATGAKSNENGSWAQ